MIRLNRMNITPIGIAAAIIFACGPFLYANIGGRGLFFYLAALYFACMLPQIGLAGGKLVIQKDRFLVLFVICVLYQLLSFLWSPVHSGETIYKYIKVVFFLIILCMNPYTEDDKKLMLWAQTLVMVLAVGTMMLHKTYTSDVGGSADRLSFHFFGVEQDPNYICLMIIPSALFLLARILGGRNTSRLDKILSTLLAVFLFLGVLGTGSRGGLLGLAAGFVIYFFAYKKFTAKKFFSGVLLFAAVFFLFQILVHYLPENIGRRLSISALLEDQGSGRLDTWLRYIRRIFSDPLGAAVGMGNSSGIYYMQWAAHNYVLESLFEYGILGLCLLLAFYWKVIRTAVTTQKWLPFSVILGMLATSLTLSCGTMLEFWLGITLSCILIQTPKGQQKEENSENCNDLHMYRKL